MSGKNNNLRLSSSVVKTPEKKFNEQLKWMLQYMDIDIQPKINDKLTSRKKEFLNEKIKRNKRYVDLLVSFQETTAELDKEANEGIDDVDGIEMSNSPIPPPDKVMVGDYLIWVYLPAIGNATTTLTSLRGTSLYHNSFKFKSMDDMKKWFDIEDNYINTCDNLFLSILEMLDASPGSAVSAVSKVLTFSIDNYSETTNETPRPFVIYIFLSKKSISNIIDVYLKVLLDANQVKKYNKAIQNLKSRGIDV